jgi:hypothetical protein
MNWERSHDGGSKERSDCHPRGKEIRGGRFSVLLEKVSVASIPAPSEHFKMVNSDIFCSKAMIGRMPVNAVDGFIFARVKKGGSVLFV